MSQLLNSKITHPKLIGALDSSVTSITIPNGFINGLPVGINITGNCYDDENILNIAYTLESKMPYKGQIAKEASR